ncbi:hypothetical protein MYX76_01560 [Desulfobacterota bacterium AH_259_B03_O07]|nr:hypothetical protein [Desulfobacterota bacterium AH_259_B03_O07]
MDNDSVQNLDQLLSKLEERRNKNVIIKGVIEFFLFAFFILSITSLLSIIYSNIIFFSIIKIALIIAICYGFWRLVISIVTKKGKIHEISHELNKLSPGLGEDSINAILLKKKLSKQDEEIGVSKSLIRAHIYKVTRKLELLDLAIAFSPKKIRNYWKPLAIILILFLISISVAPSDYRNLLFSTRLFKSEHPKLLGLADIRITYDYPSYTGIPKKIVEGSTGSVQAVKGTHITFEATPVEDMDKGKLILKNGPPLPVVMEDGKINAQFIILSDGSYFIQDKNKRLSSEVFQISSKEDHKPKIKIDLPASDTVDRSIKEKLEIHYNAYDDYGISKLELEWDSSIDKGNKVIQQNKIEPKSLEGTFIWDLSHIEAEPDEIINVKIKGLDNDTVSGPKAGISNEIRFRLSDPRLKHEDFLSVSRELQEQLIDVLADEIEQARSKDSPLSINRNGPNNYANQQFHKDENNKLLFQTKKAQTNITSKIEKALLHLESGLDKMKNDKFSDYAYYVGLSNMKPRIGDLLEERQRILPSFSIHNISRLDNLITREINEFEGDILFLDSMLEGEKLRESVVYGKNMLEKYKELEDLIKNTKNSRDGNSINDIERKISELKNLFSQLSQKLNELSGDIQRGFINPDAFPSIAPDEKLDEILKYAKNADIDTALSLLEDLKNNFQDMIASLESSFKSYSSTTLSREIMRLTEFITRINSIEKGETSLKRKTQDLKQSLLSNSSNRQNLREFVESEILKIRKLQELLNHTKDEVSLDPFSDDFLNETRFFERILDKTELLAKWLQSLEFDEALSISKEVEERITSISDLSKMGIGNIAESSREIRKSELLAKEIHTDIENLLKRKNRETKNEELARRQNDIFEKTSGLSDELNNFQSEFPFPTEIGDILNHAKRSMKNSTRNLDRKDISKAISNQEEAIKSLSKARGDAEKLLQNFQLSAKGIGPSVPLVLGSNQFKKSPLGIDTSYVEIPKPQESEFGKEFKDSLLNAFKDGSPEGYTDLNKKYYERIIK